MTSFFIFLGTGIAMIVFGFVMSRLFPDGIFEIFMATGAFVLVVLLFASLVFPMKRKEVKMTNFKRVTGIEKIYLTSDECDFITKDIKWYCLPTNRIILYQRYNLFGWEHSYVYGIKNTQITN